MSYYDGVPSYWMSRKDVMERAMTSKREKEARVRRECEANCRYFNDLQTEAVKHDNWTSENTCRVSREAYRAKMEKENKARMLNERKTKLALMLKEEKEQFEIELRKMSERKQKCCENKENVKVQENKPLKDVYRDWIRSKQTAKTLTHRNEMCKSVKMEKLHLEDEKKGKFKLEDVKKGKIKLEDDKKGKFNSNVFEENITRHVEELKMKEKETNRLRVELKILQQKQWKLEELEAKKQELINKRNKTTDMTRILKHQLKVHLQNRAREILTQLEEDREMMRQAVAETEFERKQNDLRREKNRQSAARFAKIIDEQIEAEKRRQSELGSLFNEEAGKVWKQREEQWEVERNLRHEVMFELMDGLRQETEEKILENVEQQEESVKTRGDLLRIVEEEKEKMFKNEKKLDEDEQMQMLNGAEDE